MTCPVTQSVRLGSRHGRGAFFAVRAQLRSEVSSVQVLLSLVEEAVVRQVVEPG
jgi:hypothetical protein